MQLGRIFFQDRLDQETDTALYGAISLDSLEQFVYTLLPYTLATVTKITWSPEAEINYINHVKTVTNHQPEQERVLNMVGSVFQGFEVNRIKASFCFTHRNKGCRRFSIPAPLYAIHRERTILPSVGQALEGPFNLVIGEEHYTFSSGRIFFMTYTN